MLKDDRLKNVDNVLYFGSTVNKGLDLSKEHQIESGKQVQSMVNDKRGVR